MKQHCWVAPEASFKINRKCSRGGTHHQSHLCTLFAHWRKSVKMQFKKFLPCNLKKHVKYQIKTEFCRCLKKLKHFQPAGKHGEKNIFKYFFLLLLFSNNEKEQVWRKIHILLYQKNKAWPESTTQATSFQATDFYTERLARGNRSLAELQKDFILGSIEKDAYLKRFSLTSVVFSYFNTAVGLNFTEKQVVTPVMSQDWLHTDGWKYLWNYRQGVFGWNLLTFQWPLSMLPCYTPVSSLVQPRACDI